MQITQQALRLNAMLVSLRGQDGVDVIDAICTLLIPILEVWRGSPITPSLLSKGIQVTYGWNVTESVASVFIERLENTGHLTRKASGNSGALIANPQIIDDEVTKQSSLAAEFEEIISIFEEFPLVKDDLINREMGREELSEKLVRFLISLDAYSEDEIAAQFRSQKKSTGDKYTDQLSIQDTHLSKGDVYLCARFVTWLSQSRDDLISSLSGIVGAGLLAELIEDFRKPDTLSSKSNTTIFFDAPLALSLLGASGKSAQAEARAIHESLTSIGCRILVLSDSCKEAERVLGAFLQKKPSERHGFTQGAVVRGEVEIEYITVLRNDIEAALEKFDVGVRHINIDQFPAMHQYFDGERIKDMIGRLGWLHWDAREHDANAIAYVMRLRQGRHSSDPLRNSYLFATSNSKLVSATRSYCLADNLLRGNEYGPAIDLRDLATIAWLRTGFGDSEKLPIVHLLAQSEKVLRVRKDVVERARKQIEKHSPENIEQFELLLRDSRAVTHITDRALSPGYNEDDNNSRELLDGMLAAAISVEKEESRNKLREKDIEISAVKKSLREQEETFRAENAKILKDLGEKSEELKLLTTAAQEKSKALQKRDQAILGAAATRANTYVGIIQGVTGLCIFFLSISVIFSLIVSEPPAILKIGAALFLIISSIMTVLAIYGKSFIGLRAIEGRLAYHFFSSRCQSMGIDEHEFKDSVEVQNGRLRVKRP